MKKNIIIEIWNKKFQYFSRFLRKLEAPVNMMKNSVTPHCPILA
ncbi:MAG: hypothetical protein ACTSVL_04725 [Promethearchaeota archaeon]